MAAVGADAVRGIGNHAPFTYPVEGVKKPVMAIASQAGMNGEEGGWPTLYGRTPVADGRLFLAIDTDHIRSPDLAHSSERVSYLVLE